MTLRDHRRLLQLLPKYVLLERKRSSSPSAMRRPELWMLSSLSTARAGHGFVVSRCAVACLGSVRKSVVASTAATAASHIRCEDRRRGSGRLIARRYLA